MIQTGRLDSHFRIRNIVSGKIIAKLYFVYNGLTNFVLYVFPYAIYGAV